MQTKLGIIQFYLPNRGYGFVRDPKTRAEYHFTRKGLLEPIKDKDRVCFEVVEKKQGLMAVNIRKITSHPTGNKEP